MKNHRTQNETVLLVHGLGGTKLDMWPLSRRLKRNGFSSHCWGYFSIGHRIETHVARLIQDLRKFEEDSNVEHLHLVGHSMGSIIVRAAVAQESFSKLKRIVMLAPPNGGSHVARWLGPRLKWVVPCLPQLSDQDDSYVNQLSHLESIPNIELGIVEAAHDRVIAKECLRLKRHHDYAIVSGQHGILTWYPRTQILVEQFLRFGQFDSNARPNKP
ncbi:MAG: alpha/beta hydrolase [Mariniblastus sp.]|nr:alpha/beta hydrolase [Mariniblastus sp.]